MFCVVKDRSELIGDNKYAEYSSMRKVDEGSFGDIFTVYHKKRGKIMALKQLFHRGIIQDDPYILRELWCLSRLKHTNIVELVEVVFLPGEVDIIMEYGEKGNLENYIIKNWPLHDREIFEFFHQCLSAIRFCHSRFIAHRDINPRNILLTKDHIIKVVDFGLATRCRDDKGNFLKCSDYLGLSHFLAPEVLAKRPYDPLAADVWGLGVLLYFILAACVPEKVTGSTTGKHADTFIQLPDWVRNSGLKNSVSISTFLNYILNPDPSSRPDVDQVCRLWSGIGKHTLVLSQCKTDKRRSVTCIGLMVV